MKKLLTLAATLIAAAAHAQTGVLLPAAADKPDPRILSLQEMSVNITIDDGDARVYVTQIFANHTKDPQEANYSFALPSGSTVSDFAAWNGPVRIPAVILETRQADSIYNSARSQTLNSDVPPDAEPDGSNPKTDQTFTASVTPVPAYGTERIELEYHQHLTVDSFVQNFLLPLKPSQYLQQTAGQFSIHFELHSITPLSGFQLTSKLYPLKLSTQDAHTVIGDYTAANLAIAEDLTATWTLDSHSADTLAVTTFRNPITPLPQPGVTSPKPIASEPGFFLAQTLVAPPAVVPTQQAAPRNVVLLLDTSLSMQWDKLERSYAALEAVLLALTPADHFSLILFNQDVTLYKPDPIAASADAVQQALAFVKASRLRGGTDLGKALIAGLAQSRSPGSSLYLFTDGNTDRGATILNRTIAAAYARQWAASTHPRTNIFAIGDDANLTLLKQLAQNDGLLENILSSEPIQPKLNTFLAHSTGRPISGLHLDVSPTTAVHTIYPLEPATYAGGLAAWIGDYTAPASKVTFTASAGRAGSPLKTTATVDLPTQALDHPQLPRLWAQARVNALLDQIARDGETRAAVEEIIELSRRYKFVTPYTAFLAAPRSLLRPRVIRPGDPVIRVHTDPAITSVIALFPFGLEKALRHIPSEDQKQGPDGDHLWETRFLAPADMQDGTYNVRLILRDTKGNTYSENKTFVIASTPPSVSIKLDHTRFHRGDAMLIKAEATASTRTLTARLEGAMPVDLRWNSIALASTGEMHIPDTLAPGTYTLSVTAEDIAHNVGSQEVQIDVIP